MKTKSQAALFLISFFLISCNSQTPVKNLSVTEFEKGISQMGAQLVDVRSAEEYKEKHIAKSRSIDINDGGFYKQMENLVDKSKPVYFYCLSGERSKRAAEWAMKNGYVEAYNLDGGITAWIGEGKLVTNATGTPAPSGISFDDYLKAINRTDKLVLVDFSAVWCGPCKLLKPVIAKVMGRYGSKVELLDIDVDKNSIVASNMNVRAVPMLLIYKQGKEVWRNMGFIERDLLEDKIQELLK